jgi:hypothetical protein
LKIEGTIGYARTTKEKEAEASTLMTEGNPPFTVFLTSFHDLAPPMMAKDAR